MNRDISEANAVRTIPPRAGVGNMPATICAAGKAATRRFIEFFTANIRNRNTRAAYFRAVVDFFSWCDDRRLELHDIEPIVVAAYVEYLSAIYAAPTVKQHLAAIRMCFDWLVVGQVLSQNPSADPVMSRNEEKRPSYQQTKPGCFSIVSIPQLLWGSATAQQLV